MNQDAKKRIGRPPKEPVPGQRVSLGLKVTPEIKQRLDQEARKNGRTQSQQAEVMIERAFTEQAALGGPEMQRMAYLMASAFAVSGRHSAAGKPDWIDDTGHYGAASAGVIDALLIGRTDEALLIEALLSRLLTRREWLKQQQKEQTK
jgi:hypothetical protein